MPVKSRVLIVIGITVVWLITTAAKIKYNGLVYGLDYGLYHPDGTLYTFRTLTLLGRSEIEAGNLVSNWYAEHAFKMKYFEPSSLFFDTHPMWQIYKPKVLYPILSVPFVALLGIPGMLAVPALSMLILLISVILIGFKLKNENFAFLIALFFSITPVVSRWMYANITDGLLTAITCIFVISFLYIKKDSSFLPIAIFLVILGSLTRVSLLLWLAICIGIYLSSQKRSAIILALTSLMMFIPSAIGNLGTGILPNEQAGSLFERPVQLFLSMIRVGFFELGQLLVLDRILLCLLVLAVGGSVMNFSRLSSKFFLLVLVSLWITGAVNGTIGVNFRYQLPLLPFIAYMLLDSFRIKFEFMKFGRGSLGLRKLKN
jgi:4-amino-4-deoxy-L-arabinose transferase-like glycosyltransferase